MVYGNEERVFSNRLFRDSVVLISDSAILMSISCRCKSVHLFIQCRVLSVEFWWH